LTAPDDAAGKTLRCAKCKAAIPVSDSRAEKPEPLPLDDEEGDTPEEPKYKESTVKNVLVYILAIVGALVLWGGFELDTTVKSGESAVYNIGLLEHKLRLTLGGLGCIALAILLRIMVVVEATSRLYRKRITA
jgi:hypothetical protein